jgi:hypothetical protein
MTNGSGFCTFLLNMFERYIYIIFHRLKAKKTLQTGEIKGFLFLLDDGRIQIREAHIFTDPMDLDPEYCFTVENYPPY